MVSIKTSEQSVAASGLLYEAMGMADPSHTHRHTFRNVVKFLTLFSLPFRLPLLLLLLHSLLFFPHFSFRRESIDRPLPKVIFNQR